MTKLGRPAKYNWTEWLNSETPITITYDVDFLIAPSSMVSMLRQKASKHRLHIDVTEDPMNQTITFKFFPREVGDEECARSNSIPKDGADATESIPGLYGQMVSGT